MILIATMFLVAAPTETCVKLADEYETISKRLALTTVEGLGDSSAVRATMREAEQTKVLAEGNQLIELMKGHKCQLPSMTPKAGYYIVAALACQTSRIRSDGTEDQACDMDKWVRSETVKKP